MWIQLSFLMFGFWVFFWNSNILAVSIGKKRKEQHDANQAAMGMNPAYNGAYGATPQVSKSFSSTTAFPRYIGKHWFIYAFW